MGEVWRLVVAGRLIGVRELGAVRGADLVLTLGLAAKANSSLGKALLSSPLRTVETGAGIAVAGLCLPGFGLVPIE